MSNQIRILLDEADIGSGEKSEGERETEKLLEQVPRQPPHSEDEALNDARAEQQMIEGNVDTSEACRRLERKRMSQNDQADRSAEMGDQKDKDKPSSKD